MNTTSIILDMIRDLSNLSEISLPRTPQVDPVVANAHRDRATVRLGLDPDFTKRAAEGAQLHEQIEKLQHEYEDVQEDLRKYGREKRQAYQDHFKTSVTTVGIPYALDGQDTRYVQVVCTNRYTVNREMIQNNEDLLGSWKDRLLKTETTMKLKPEGATIIRKLLGELGLVGAELDQAMASMFDTETKVSAREDYETQVQKAPEGIRPLLDQAVVRVAPGIKY